MRIGRHLCAALFPVALSVVAMHPIVAEAGDVWVCSGSTTNVSVSVYPLYYSNTRVNFCNLAASTRYRVTVQKPCYGPTADVWWSWLNSTTWMGYGSGRSESREFTTAPGGSYYLTVRGHDLCCTCSYKVSLTPVTTGGSGLQSSRDESTPTVSEEVLRTVSTWGQLKVIYR